MRRKIIGSVLALVCLSLTAVMAVSSVPGTEKWAFQTGDSIQYSSPALGADGTIYVGSIDGYLYAVMPNG